MTCLIIDDESLAQDIIEHYILQTPFLELIGKCDNALEAFSLMGNHQVDLIFLDIKLPKVNGLDFIRLLKHPPKVILTTAHTEYAVASYELNVVDYLVKPIGFERFLQAVDKVKAVIKSSHQEAAHPAALSKDLFIKSEGRLRRINTADIHYVESSGNYLLIHTGTKRIVTYATMVYMETQLAAFPDFVRIHKSYLINKNHITEITGNVVTVGKSELPVGAVYKPDMMKLLRVI
jgi:DNA-binding LytR/AlgR family response regulator